MYDTTLVLLGNVAFMLACLAVGVRLSLLARKTGELPEKLIATSFLTAGFLANAVSIGWAVLNPPQSWGVPLVVLLRSLIAVGAAAMLAVAWKIFRAHDRWAQVLFWVTLPFLALYAVRRVVVGPLGIEEMIRHPLFYTESLALFISYAWFAWESVSHYVMLGRRRRLGLESDIGLERRMLLWGTGMGAISLLILVMQTSPVLSVVAGQRLPVSELIAILGLLCSACLWLAFFPPAAWRRSRATVGAAETP